MCCQSNVLGTWETVLACQGRTCNLAWPAIKPRTFLQSGYCAVFKCKVFISLFSATTTITNAENHLLQCMLHRTHGTSCYPTSDKTTISCYFNHRIHPCWTLSAARSFLLHLLSLFSPYIKWWVALSPHAALSRVESPPETLAYLSSAAQTSKSACASHRDGSATRNQIANH